VGSQQCLYFVAQVFITGADPLQKRTALLNRNLKRLSENHHVTAGFIWLHGSITAFSPRHNRGRSYIHNSEISSQKGQGVEISGWLRDARSSLIAGVFFAFSTFVMKALVRLPPAQGIAAMQAINVAEAVYAAATDGRDKLRYPAGADSVMLAELRKSLPEQTFIARMRTMFGGEPVKQERPCPLGS
jgi:hypothetical protein